MTYIMPALMTKLTVIILMTLLFLYGSMTLFLTGVSAIVLVFVIKFTMFRHVIDHPVLHSTDSALTRYLLKHCKIMTEPYKIPFWAKNAHVQTLLGNFLPASQVNFSRDYVQLEDGGQCALDWAENIPSGGMNLRHDSPVFLVLPGLTGDAQGMSHMCKLGLTHGYRSVVFNKRGHGNSEIKTPKLQSFGDPTDLRQVVIHIKEKYPESILTAAGFSAGSGLLASYLGEFGASCLLSVAVAVSPGYDGKYLFEHCITQPYNYILLRSLKRLVSKHAKMLSKVIDIQKALDSKNLKEFEEYLYCKIYNYSSLDEYWDNNNPIRAVDKTAIPMLCISSLDDPVCRKDCIRYSIFENRPEVMLLTTEKGGHCGFLSGNDLEHWGNKVIIDYITTVIKFKSMEQDSS